jgi:molybdopterin/thiamine biosynthesis adenylyltransferase
VSDERFSRQIIAFGSEGQERIAAARVGIVGVGGIGSQVAQSLAYLGVQTFLLVDDDIVEKSNLNRLIGAIPVDAEEGRLKVDVTERMICQINPNAIARKLPSNLRNAEVMDALSGMDYLFGCVDDDSGRLILSELAAAFEIPLIDSASEIEPEEGKVKEFGGRVIVALPGDFCALCAGQIDLEIAKTELESPSEKEFRQRHGYGLGKDAPAPAVVSLNGIIANLAVTEFIMLVTRMRPYNREVTYKGMRGVVTVSSDKKKEGCIICELLPGKRESAHIKRYAMVGLPKDLPM